MKNQSLITPRVDLDGKRTDTVADIFETYASKIDKYIQNHIEPIDPRLRDMISYHFGWMDEELRETKERQGKRFRASMCLLVYDALENQFEPCMPLAASIEMIHNFSLIHDDIEDGDQSRRGRPTVWKIWGKPLAINAGDLLHVLCYTTFKDLLALNNDEGSMKRIYSAQEVVFQTVIKLTEGQHHDLLFESKEPYDVSVDEYISMIYGKSASLIECATWAGAIMAPSATTSMIDKYRKFGLNIGLAFQMRDDILGIWGNPLLTGKPRSNDIFRKKKTYAVLHAFENATDADTRKLKSIYQKNKIIKNDVVEVIEILTKTKSYESAQLLASKYYNEAVENLNSVGINSSSQVNLKRIAEFLAVRNY